MLKLLPRVHRALGVLPCLALAACASPDMRPPTALPTPPARWAQPVSGADALTAPSTDWWRAFGSEGLSQAIEQAERQSYDMAASAALARQALAAAEPATGRAAHQ